MSNKLLTVGRQFGSGGYDIAKRVSEKLSMGFYDKELLKESAKNSGLCEEVFHDFDERPTNSFLYSLVMDPYSAIGFHSGTMDMPLNHKVFLASFDTIKAIADKESAVFVGRCADYALENRDNVLNVFIYANIDDRIKRVAERLQIDEKQAKDVINKQDKQRSSYYNYYTTKKWGAISSYDLCINSSILGIEKTSDYIIEFLNAM
ncbi:MAG: cytidylate kinase-like family protein [Lachnospiraceae bacterium]|nr:cytidylate kinase-like family protein [Lachnospiraceae bacterium]